MSESHQSFKNHYYKDGKEYCLSPKCMNECGRRLSRDERKEVIREGKIIVFRQFCGDTGLLHESPQEPEPVKKKHMI